MATPQDLLLAELDRNELLDADQAVLTAAKQARSGQAQSGRVELEGGAVLYSRSLFRSRGILFFLARPGAGEARRLFLVSRDPLPPAFNGDKGEKGDSFLTAGRYILEAPCSHENYLAMKEYLPFTAPVSLRNRRTSLGCGDRLGLAGPGHIRAVRGKDIHPVLAQLSMRELSLTGRTYPQVVCDAAFSVLQEGYEEGYGADGDHLKTIGDIDTAVDAGMPMITLDLTEVMDPAPGYWSDSEVEAAFARLPEDTRRRVLERYSGKGFPLEKSSITISPVEAKRCALMYWKALDFTETVDRRLRERRGDAYDLEVSIDETTTPTIPSHHLFIAAELQRRQVTVNSLAPRFIGEFQKGIDYIGDLATFEEQFTLHCEIASHFGGYKISIHSGSDKFSAYPIIGTHTRLRVHVKTAGTSWLESVRAVSIADPTLFREMLQGAYRHLPEALKLYHITPDLGLVPDPASLSDQDLPRYLDLPESRQLLHVTYGGLLNDPSIRPRFFAFLADNEELHYKLLEKHLGRHVELLGV
jgi:tagaturonate epimerase